MVYIMLLRVAIIMGQHELSRSESPFFAGKLPRLNYSIIAALPVS
jgi:hypothetical protein